MQIWQITEIDARFDEVVENCKSLTWTQETPKNTVARLKRWSDPNVTYSLTAKTKHFVFYVKQSDTLKVSEIFIREEFK